MFQTRIRTYIYIVRYYSSKFLHLCEHHGRLSLGLLVQIETITKAVRYLSNFDSIFNRNLWCQMWRLKRQAISISADLCKVYTICDCLRMVTGALMRSRNWHIWSMKSPLLATRTINRVSEHLSQWPHACVPAKLLAEIRLSLMK